MNSLIKIKKDSSILIILILRRKLTTNSNISLRFDSIENYTFEIKYFRFLEVASRCSWTQRRVSVIIYSASTIKWSYSSLLDLQLLAKLELLIFITLPVILLSGLIIWVLRQKTLNKKWCWMVQRRALLKISNIGHVSWALFTFDVWRKDPIQTEIWW